MERYMQTNCGKVTPRLSKQAKRMERYMLRNSGSDAEARKNPCIGEKAI